MPIPTYEGHEQLATYFAKQVEQDRQRRHYAKERTIGDLWEEDHKKLLRLPEQAYEAFHMSAAVVNKYGEVIVEGTPMPLAGLVPSGSEVLLQWYWDRVVIRTKEHAIIRELPRPYTEQTVDIPWEQVFQNWLRKPRSVRYSPFVRMLPASMSDYVCADDLSMRKERLQAMLHWCKVYTLEQMDQVLAKHTPEATVQQLTAALGLKQGKRDIPATWSENLSPLGTLVTDSLQRYDRLVMGGAACPTI